MSLISSARFQRSSSDVGPTDSTDQLPDDDHIGPLGDLGLQGRVSQKTLANKVGRSDVGIQSELLSELQETLFRSDGTYTPLGSSDGTCKGSNGEI
jgi:hypothetical protein